MYTYIYTLLVCLCVFPLVFNTCQNSWTNRAQILWPKGRYMDDQSFIKLYPKAFNFHKLLKTHEKIFENPRMFFLFVLYCSQMFTDRATIKNSNRRWVRSAPKASMLHLTKLYLIWSFACCQSTNTSSKKRFFKNKILLYNLFFFLTLGKLYK